MKLEPFRTTDTYFGWRVRIDEGEFFVERVGAASSRFLSPRIVGLVAIRPTKKSQKLLERRGAALRATEAGRLSTNVWSAAGSGSPRGTVEASHHILAAAKAWLAENGTVGEAYEIRSKTRYPSILDIEPPEPVRCYEHEDCRRHPALGEACFSARRVW